MGYRDTYFNNNSSNHGWYTCAHCGRRLRKGDADIDHIIPREYGGWDNEDNLQCLCVHCNRSKGCNVDRALDDYKRKNGRKESFEFHDFFDEIRGLF